MTGRGEFDPRIAISGTEFRDEPIDTLLRTADEVGVTAIELWYPENLRADADGVALARLAAWPGQVAAVSAGVEIGETSDVPGSRSRLIEALELADRLGAPVVNTYFGAPGYRDDRRSGEVLARNLEPVLRRAESLGVTVVLENEFDAFGRDRYGGDLTRRPHALREAVRRIGSARLRLNFDAANFYCAGVEPFPYAYEVLADDVEYLHVKDIRRADPAVPAQDGPSVRYHDYDRAYVTTALGSGAVNWPGLLARLAADRYPGPLTLEPHVRPEHRTAALAQAAGWLRAEVAGLRGHPTDPSPPVPPLSAPQSILMGGH
ncbi:sugar phosphate isomerase/epimerase family protein [Actinacidiphila sp. bgisy144]|uniref:sugar phosphate isomerase/epimerase family protein n=1 Tax=Actinacidiphila sp. bgisy144 TaxID=3413791 RepID=UPI003EB9020B